jgi:hypothetical protein
MIILELNRVCKSSGRDEGKIFLTGNTFAVTKEHRRWGKFERDICVVNNGTSNNGGYWVSDSYERICESIKYQDLHSN